MVLLRIFMCRPFVDRLCKGTHRVHKNHNGNDQYEAKEGKT